ncbi:thiocillin family RiPP [Amycolatopsis keratiniphila]|uniref:thiocillin family RiPP n=1 Tax=Amycolatopsis keratiniphila TaxID=129921 RepID=UPI00087D1E65|nr:thiocillin family RiPP [Amycolatopsis keratiniphila]SDU10124.1 hypothetical protein SAMN04489733_1136 [Amycolatopsis keratiniphila]
MKQSENDRDVALDLWAEESGAELAAGACTRGSASTAGTASCPISTAGCATTAGSAC